MSANNPFDPFASSSPSAQSSSSSSSSSSTSSTSTFRAGASSNPFDVFGASFVGQIQQHLPLASNGGGSGQTSSPPASANAAILPPSSFRIGGGGGNDDVGVVVVAAPPTSRRHRRVVPHDARAISTLETNWDPWLAASASAAAATGVRDARANQPTYLIVAADLAGCDVGAEGALRWSSGRSIVTSSSSTSSSSSPSSMSMSMSTSPPIGNESSSSSRPGPSIGGIASARAAAGGLGLLRSGLRRAQKSIEQSVTTIAMRADGGKNPDLACASLHYLSTNNGTSTNGRMADAMGTSSSTTATTRMGEAFDVCLSRTEWVELPSSPSSSSSSASTTTMGGGGELLPFSIPLCLPDLDFLDTTARPVRLTLRLYVRSGAALLKAVANREYCVGECTLSYSSVVGRIRGTSSSGCATSSSLVVVPFDGGMLAESTSHPLSSSSSRGKASFFLTALPRVKFASIGTHGWTLADPTSTNAANAGTRDMFQLPLDQGYAFPLEGHDHNNRNASLFANERAVESTLVLPLATACSRLFAAAASRSVSHAANALSRTRGRECLVASVDDRGGIAHPPDGTAFVEVGLVALVLSGPVPPSAPMSSSISRGDMWTLDPALPLCGIGGLDIPSARTGISFQAPHTVFEESLAVGSCPLLDGVAGAGYVAGVGVADATEAIAVRFRPRIHSAEDDLLPGVAGTRADGRYVGSIRLEAAVANPNVDTIASTVGTNSCVEGLIELEDYLHRRGDDEGGKVPTLAPAFDSNTGRRIGTFVILLRITSNPDLISSSPIASIDNGSPASSGLVSVVGLDTLVEESGLAPYVDCDAPRPGALSVASSSNPGAMRRRQVATMGNFVTPRFLKHQAIVRDQDAKSLGERYAKYSQSLLSAISPEIITEDETGVPLFKRHAPRPFRPSHSRGDKLLTGIGFNVHVQSLSLNIVQDGQRPSQVGVTQSVTHGAFADHAKGFGGQPSSRDKDGKKASEDLAPRGGLKKLESKRLEIAKELDECVTALISAVGDHFRSRSQRQQSVIPGARPSRHVPPNLPAVTHYRAKAVECAHRLHSLTWDVAVRRANCFSQALGVAVTSYMASLSDGGPGWSNGGVWARHGYLITFEGLLSAVGKELGMIEDASVAISMLRMVSVILVPDNTNSSPPSDQQRVPVTHSPCVRWVCLNYIIPYGSHSKTQYRLEIGLDPTYYEARVPDPLKNGQAVRFFPVLFQMGVDIRQWGVNAGRSVASQIKEKPKQSGGADVNDLDNAINVGEMERGGSILDDEDDEGDSAIADDEILYVLNVEGYRKLNAYAHSVNPTGPGVTAASTSVPVFDSVEQQQQAQLLPAHPSLVLLGEAIKASAGKMEHSVLDKAATACQRLYGGSTVFCKSGKDRTAMQVTFKQAQFVQRVIDRKGGSLLEDTPISYDEVIAKSTLMRKHGTRIPICEKNAGEPKFAFNPLQRKFMPEMLRPDVQLCTWSKPET